MHAHSTALATVTPAAASLAERLTTADGIAAAFLAGFGDSTRAAYARDLRRWSEFLDQVGVEPFEAQRVHVDAFCREAEQNGIAPATLARRLSALSGFYGYALDEGLIARSPVRVRRPKVASESPRLGLDRGEAAALLEASVGDPRDHALACLLVLNGLRITEALAIDLEDLDVQRGHRVVQLRRKGGKRQLAALAPRTSGAIDSLVAGRDAELAAWVAERDDGTPVFITRSGRRLDRQGGWKIVRRLAREAAIRKTISPHSCRHGFVTAALDAGVSLRDVQDAAGHADPRTTRRYDRGRHSLDRHATYAVASFVAGG